MDVVVGLVTLLVVFLGAYFYGVKVGLRAGYWKGREACDVEWARMLENGMVGPGAPLPSRPTADEVGR